jgi:hypothetical protein
MPLLYWLICWLICCRVDDQLNQVEQQPSELHQKIYQFTNGPVGQATSKGVQTAAKFTISATIETAKAAAPIGKWALQQVRGGASKCHSHVVVQGLTLLCHAARGFARC